MKCFNEITKEMAIRFYGDLCEEVYEDRTKNSCGIMSVELIAEHMGMSVEDTTNFCNAMIKFGITERQGGMIVI